MSELKIATFNTEWMISIFGGLWNDWQSPTIPDTFPGKNFGGIYLDPIRRCPRFVPAHRGVVRDTGAQIIGIEEGPPLRRRWKFSCSDSWTTSMPYIILMTSRSRSARWCAVTSRTQVTAFAHDDPETQPLHACTRFSPGAASPRTRGKSTALIGFRSC